MGCVCAACTKVYGVLHSDKNQEGKTRLRIRADGSGTEFSISFESKEARQKKGIQADRLLTCMGCFDSAAQAGKE